MVRERNLESEGHRFQFQFCTSHLHLVTNAMLGTPREYLAWNQMWTERLQWISRSIPG
jgi:hypothetical protein